MSLHLRGAKGAAQLLSKLTGYARINSPVPAHVERQSGYYKNNEINRKPPYPPEYSAQFCTKPKQHNTSAEGGNPNSRIPGANAPSMVVS